MTQIEPVSNTTVVPLAPTQGYPAVDDAAFMQLLKDWEFAEASFYDAEATYYSEKDRVALTFPEPPMSIRTGATEAELHATPYMGGIATLEDLREALGAIPEQNAKARAFYIQKMNDFHAYAQDVQKIQDAALADYRSEMEAALKELNEAYDAFWKTPASTATQAAIRFEKFLELTATDVSEECDVEGDWLKSIRSDLKCLSATERGV